MGVSPLCRDHSKGPLTGPRLPTGREGARLAGRVLVLGYRNRQPWEGSFAPHEVSGTLSAPIGLYPTRKCQAAFGGRRDYPSGRAGSLLRTRPSSVSVGRMTQ